MAAGPGGTGYGAGRHGEQSLQVRPGTLRAGDGLSSANQSLELPATTAATVIVDGHCWSFAGGSREVKGPLVVALPHHRGMGATSGPPRPGKNPVMQWFAAGIEGADTCAT